MRTAPPLVAVLGTLLAIAASPLGCKPQAPLDRGGLVSRSATPDAAPTISGSAPAGSSVAFGPDLPDRCGGLDCRTFPTAVAAFEHILATERPLVLAIGEAHAQKGAAVDSSTKRFTDEILPLVQGKASDLLVEAMMPPTGCKPQVEVVREKQKAATAPQAATNQSDYVVLGTEAKKRGIVPDLLRPTCEDLDAIDKAGPEAIGASLATIARLTSTQVDKLLVRIERLNLDRFVITYGGALHNDLVPGAGKEDWSYAKKLVERTKGRYVEVDLFVPDFIRDDATWQKLEWRAHYDPARFPDRAVVFHPREHGYVVILPHKDRAP